MASHTVAITFTAAAIAHLQRQLAQAETSWLRLSLRRAGCSGLEYVWQSVDGPYDGDLVARPGDDLNIAVDAEDYRLALGGLRVDFQEDALAAALVYSNPNQKGSCGCGVSFTM
ncbi:MAG: iron-sulfur cluster assembly accessory protein [Mariprofundales bacterium]|nr:iron-sulfur cluster assembly accessory protein [Mariprofundales bacterium]